MDSLSYQKLGMPGMLDTCIVTYNKANLISDLGKADSGTKDDDFQKLMDKAASSTSKDTKTESVGKTEEKAPVEKEDSLTRIKKMLEQNGNALAFKPDSYLILIDKNTGEMTASYDPGEWVMVFTDEGVENIPITDLEPWQQAQLDQLLIDPNPIDVSDPRVDALLEATAPGADNSPAAMLERVVARQTGKEIQQVVEELQPQQEDDDQVVITDAAQGAQFIFRDVKNIPVKVAEVENPEQAAEPNVAQQVDTQLAQALEQGESMVRVQLTPENLGTVTVEISQNADGVLHIALSAHSSETRGLLERHAANLQGLVSSRTQQEVQVDVQRGQESQQNQQHQNYDGHNGHAQDGRDRRQQHHEHTSSQDFMQQLRLGLIPTDGEF